MASAQQAPGRLVPGRPVSRVVVDLARPGGRTYRIDAVDRVLRMWFLLNTVNEERLMVAVSPGADQRMQHLLKAVSEELERSVSPALADELHHLLGWSEAGPAAEQVRVAYASLLGWTGGLAITMLSQLETVRGRPHLASTTLARRPARRGRTGGGSHRQAQMAAAHGSSHVAA